jgi:hypothetical protein
MFKLFCILLISTFLFSCSENNDTMVKRKNVSKDSEVVPLNVFNSSYGHENVLGNVKEIETYYLESDKYYEYEIYKFDRNKNLIEFEIYSDTIAKVSHYKEVNRYDLKGRVIFNEVWQKNGLTHDNSTITKEYSYLENLNRVDWLVNNNGVITSFETIGEILSSNYVYKTMDSSGLRVRELTYDFSGNLLMSWNGNSRIEYSYDQNNRHLGEVRYQNDLEICSSYIEYTDDLIMPTTIIYQNLYSEDVVCDMYYKFDSMNNWILETLDSTFAITDSSIDFIRKIKYYE